jgi:hypothetical protein
VQRLHNAQVCPDGTPCPLTLAAGNLMPSFTLQLGAHQLYVLTRVGQGASECEALREAVRLEGCNAAATLFHGVTHGRTSVNPPFHELHAQSGYQGHGCGGRAHVL